MPSNIYNPHYITEGFPGVLGAEPLGEGVAEDGWRSPAKPGMTAGCREGDSSPAGSFLQEHDHVVLVVRIVEGLSVAGAQRGHRVGVVPEEEHPAVQACHVELAVDVDAVGTEGGPQAVINEPFPDVFFEQVVAGAALDLQECFLALEPGEYRAEHGVRPPFVGGRTQI